MPNVPYAVLNLIIIAIDFRAGISPRPDNLVLTALDNDDPIWCPVWDDAEFDIVDKMLNITIPEDGYKLDLRHRVNEQGYDDYRLVVDAKSAAKAARKNRQAANAAIAAAQATAAAAE